MQNTLVETLAAAQDQSASFELMMAEGWVGQSKPLFDSLAQALADLAHAMQRFGNMAEMMVE